MSEEKKIKRPVGERIMQWGVPSLLLIATSVIIVGWTVSRSIADEHSKVVELLDQVGRVEERNKSLEAALSNAEKNLANVESLAKKLQSIDVDRTSKVLEVIERADVHPVEVDVRLDALERDMTNTQYRLQAIFMVAYMTHDKNYTQPNLFRDVLSDWWAADRYLREMDLLGGDDRGKLVSATMAGRIGSTALRHAEEHQALSQQPDDLVELPPKLRKPLATTRVKD